MKNLLPFIPTKKLATMFAICCKVILLSVLSFTKASAQTNTFILTPDSVQCYVDLDVKIYVVITDLAGIDTGGYISVQFPPNWGAPQDTLIYTLNPNAQNPVQIKCRTNASVHFSFSTNFANPLVGVYTNEVHISVFKITGTVPLVVGDTVEIDYGAKIDSFWGFTPSRLARTEQFYFQTQHDGLSAPSAIDSSSVVQYPQHIYRLNALAKSNPDISTPFTVNVVAFDKLNNPDYFYRGTIHFSNVDGDSTHITLPPDYTFTPNDAGVHDFTMTVTDYGYHRIQIRDITTGMSTIMNPVMVDTSGMKVWWGDLHTHSQYSHHGLHLPIDVFTYGKNISFLDYLAFTEHDYIPDSLYRSGIAIANQFNQDGNFVTFNGYEWSTNNTYGHQIALFNNSNPPGIITNHNSVTYFSNTVKQQGGLIDITHPTGLWGGTGNNTAPGYAEFYVRWEYFDPAVQTMVEITGNSGICFEFYPPDTNAPYVDWTYRKVWPGTSVQDGLARNYIVGFIGASDNHQGRPGKNPNPEADSAYTYLYHEKTSKEVGVCASYAPTLTRNDIFTSLGSRHNYATTGARILLKFNIGSHMMGDYFVWDSLAGWPNLTGTIHGTDLITRVDIVKNNQNIQSFTPGAYDYSFSYIDSAATYGSYYYIRVFQDSTTDMAWSSPIWLNDSSSFTTNQLYLQTKFDVDIYPNPNNGIFQLQFFNNYSTTCLLTIDDVTGKEVYNQTAPLREFQNSSITINVPGLNDGVYFLNVTCDNYIVHKKLIIEQTKKK